MFFHIYNLSVMFDYYWFYPHEHYVQNICRTKPQSEVACMKNLAKYENTSQFQDKTFNVTIQTSLSKKS